MANPAINYLKQGLLLLSFALIWNCAGRKSPQTTISNPIYLNKEAEVSIQYEYDVVTLTAPIEIKESSPTAYKLGLFKRSHPAEPFIEKVFFPGEPIKIVLPRNVFDTEELGNRAVLTPFGSDFNPLEHLFSLTEEEELTLPPFIIKPPPAILKIYCFSRGDSLPIAEALISVVDEEGQPKIFNTDSTGYARVETSRPGVDDDVKISVDTQGKTPPWLGRIMLNSEGRGEKTIWLGSYPETDSSGVVYTVISDLVPLRRGPENGSESIFLLSEGDRITVTKISGDRVFGSTEVYIEAHANPVKFSGWVLKKFLKVYE